MSKPSQHQSRHRARISLALATLPAVILGLVGISYLRHEAVIAEKDLIRSGERYAQEISRQLREEYETFLTSEVIVQRSVTPNSVRQFELPSMINSAADREAYQVYRELLNSSSAEPGNWKEKLPSFKEIRTPSGLPLYPIAQLRTAELFGEQQETEKAALLLQDLLNSVVNTHPSLISSDLLARTSQVAEELELEEQLELEKWIADFQAKTATRSILHRNRDYLSRFGDQYPWFEDRGTRHIRVSPSPGKVLVLSKPELEDLAGAALETTIREASLFPHPLAFRLQFETRQINPAPFNDQTVRQKYFDSNGFDLIAHNQSGRELVLRGTGTPFNLRVTAADYHGFENAVRKRILQQGAFLVLVMLCLGLGIRQTWRTLEAQRTLTERQSNLISAVSHELRSPVAGIRLMAERLIKNDSTEKSRENYSRLIVKESTRLGTLIENILDTGRITDGRKAYQLEWTDVGALIRDTVDRMLPIAESGNRKIEFLHDGMEVTANIDPVAIQQAMGNLIDNALKFSDEGTTVTLGLRFDPAENSIALSVADRGCGISRDDQSKVFDLFYRATPELQREHSGTGLGLHLVKHIVESHGGSVRVESNPGEGSTFEMIIPREQKAGK